MCGWLAAAVWGQRASRFLNFQHRVASRKVVLYMLTKVTQLPLYYVLALLLRFLLGLNASPKFGRKVINVQAFDGDFFPFCLFASGL